jgi:hypothetical protein
VTCDRYAIPDMSVDTAQMQRAVRVMQEVGLVPPGAFPASRLWGGDANLAVALRTDSLATVTGDAPQKSAEVWQQCGEDLSGW